ncbi:MAG: hypothetical protein JKY95_07440 [Planctomycetaceae bacterium]|nr:hypothetical protein [Planctomycetaceae bacterium]
MENEQKGGWGTKEISEELQPAHAKSTDLKDYGSGPRGWILLGPEPFS